MIHDERIKMHKAVKALAPPFYIAVFAAANIVTAHTIPADIGPFLVTWGTWIIGATFVLRDLVQLAYGRAVAYLCIAASILVAAVTSAVLGDTLWIVVGSAAAIALSESLDTEVFTRLRAKVSTRIAISGIFGSALDSVAFSLIALSPWTSGIVPWDQMLNVIVGQMLAKFAVQIIAAAVWRASPAPELQPA